MRRIFTLSFLTAALVAASFNSFAQTTCTTPNTCSGVNATTTDFNANNGGFSASGTMAYNAGAGDFRTTNPNPANGTGFTATITSPQFIKAATSPNAVQAGFFLTVGGNKVDVTNVRLNIVDGTGTVIAFCNQNPAAGNSQLCFGVSNPLIVPGMSFRYQFVITYDLINNPNAAAGLVSFDNFGYASISNAPLPVKFSGFEGKAINGGVNLSWNVGAEENVSRYEVEKSNDSRNFTTIGAVEAIGKDAYSFIDSKATTATTYYRLKAVDVDGKLTYSAIVTMKGGRSSIALKGFPTPVISNFTLQHATATAASEITISSAEGREVKSVVPAKGTQQTTISLASLRPGVYVIRYSDGNGEVETLKVVKQ